jgi:hypothetical protein
MTTKMTGQYRTPTGEILSGLLVETRDRASRRTFTTVAGRTFRVTRDADGYIVEHVETTDA